MKMSAWALRAALGLAAVAALAPAAVRAQESAGTDEAEIYRAWYNESDPVQKLDKGREYLRAFPQGQYAAYLSTWVKGEEIKQKWAAAEKKFAAALKVEDSAALFQSGEQLLQIAPDNLYVLYNLAYRGLELARKNPPNYSHTSAALRHARHAVELIERGKMLENITDKTAWESKWKAITLGNLHELQGLIALRDDREPEAIAAFERIARLQPQEAMPHFYLGKIYNDSYQKLVEQLPADPEARAAPEHSAVVQKANSTLDQVIDHWARVVAYAEPGSPYRSVVEKPLEGYYRFRHADDADGLARLIASLKGGPTGG